MIDPFERITVEDKHKYHQGHLCSVTFYFCNWDYTQKPGRDLQTELRKFGGTQWKFMLKLPAHADQLKRLSALILHLHYDDKVI